MSNIKKHIVKKNNHINNKNNIDLSQTIVTPTTNNDNTQAILSNSNPNPNPIYISASKWEKLKNIIYILNTALSKRRYFSTFLFLSFPLFITLLIYIIPYQPSIPAASALKEANGIFDYIVEDKHRYGKYTIDGKVFNCGQILHSYPFDNCPVTIEIKTFKGQPIQAKWYNQKVGFTYKPVLVEMIFDNDIKIMGIKDTQKMMMKLHKKNQQFFTILVPIMFIIYFMILFASLFYLYNLEKKIYNLQK